MTYEVMTLINILRVPYIRNVYYYTNKTIARLKVNAINGKIYHLSHKININIEHPFYLGP